MQQNIISGSPIQNRQSKNCVQRPLVEKSRWRHIRLEIIPLNHGNHASQIKSYYETLLGSHGRPFRIRHVKKREATPAEKSRWRHIVALIKNCRMCNFVKLHEINAFEWLTIKHKSGVIVILIKLCSFDSIIKTNMSVYNFHDICDGVFKINWYFGWYNTFALTLVAYNTFALNNKHGCYSIEVIHTCRTCSSNEQNHEMFVKKVRKVLITACAVAQYSVAVLDLLLQQRQTLIWLCHCSPDPAVWPINTKLAKLIT